MKLIAGANVSKIPNGIKIIGRNSFYGRINITSLEIPNTVTEIANCINGETITLDGTYKIAVTDNEKHKETLCSDFNYSYLDIVVDEEYSENVYSSTLPCEITVSYSPIRKVGVY